MQKNIGPTTTRGRKIDFEKEIQKAKAFAIRRGMESEADDFAQEFAIQLFETGQARLDWSFADYLRKRFGSSRSGCGRLKQFETHGRLSIDAPIDSSEGSGSSFGDVIGDSRFSPDSSGELGDLVELIGNIRGRRGHMIYLLALEEFTRDEVAKELGVSASRVSQLLSDAREKLSFIRLLPKGVREWAVKYVI